MTTGVPPGSTDELAVLAVPGEDGFVRLRIYRVHGDRLGECLQSVALYPESARRVAQNLTMASIECEEGIQ